MNFAKQMASSSSSSAAAASSAVLAAATAAAASHAPVTLDGKHTSILDEFRKNDKVRIPKLEADIQKWKTLIREQTLTSDQLYDLKDKIAANRKQIRQLKKQYKDYYLDNSQYIFEYFEQRKNNVTTTTPIVSGASAGSQYSHSDKNQKLMAMFRMPKPATGKSGVGTPSTLPTEQRGGIFTPVPMTTAMLVQKYMANVDNTFVDMQSYVCQADVCQSCHRGELIPFDDEGLLICNNTQCAVGVPYLIDNEKPSYKDPPKEITVYAYKKINHFKEILAQFQGKETTHIEPAVIEQIKKQIKKERIEMSNLTYYVVKDILKKLNLNRYYEHIAFIKNILGIKPPIFSQELEKTLYNLFIEIQVPYAKTCPDDRVNFLHYHYVLFKFCELLQETTYLNEIPSLKDREKLIEQDEIWRKICAELNWEFIPTV